MRTDVTGAMLPGLAGGSGERRVSTAVAAPCDDGVAASVAPAPRPHAALTLATSILASSLAFVDGSAVNVALPAMGRGLGGPPAELPWIVDAYLLPLGALVLLGGAAGDRYGRRRLLLAGIAAFAAASLLCAAAPGFGWLLAGRALQGAAAAMLMPNSLAVLGAAFAGEARGRAIGTWAAVGAVAGAVGPLAGGWLVDAVGWRAIFLVNLPLAAVALALGRRFVGESRDPDARALDWAGAAAATACLATLTWGLTRLGGEGAGDPAGLAAVAAGLVLLPVLVAVERRRGERAMMPLALFATPSFVGLTLLTFLLYGALGGLLILLPYRLIEAGGYAAVTAGAALLPLPLVIGLASRPAGRLAARIGPRLPLTLAPIVVAAGLAMAARIDPARGYVLGVLPAVLVVALGLAGAVAPLTTAVMASVDARHTGTASGLNSAVARIGGLVATALVGGVLARRGEALVGAFAVACGVGAAMSLAAGASAFLTLGTPRPAAGRVAPPSPRTRRRLSRR